MWRRRSANSSTDRRELEEYQALAKVVGRFEQRYRLYAGTQSRRQARVLRQAQTEFDNASRARGAAQDRFEKAQAEKRVQGNGGSRLIFLFLSGRAPDLRPFTLILRCRTPIASRAPRRTWQRAGRPCNTPAQQSRMLAGGPNRGSKKPAMPPSARPAPNTR